MQNEYFVQIVVQGGSLVGLTSKGRIFSQFFPVGGSPTWAEIDSPEQLDGFKPLPDEE